MLLDKVFHIRVKVESHTTFYLKGICISDKKANANKHVLKQVSSWLSTTTKNDNRKIKIIESKELRSDFLMQVKNESN